MDDTPKNIQVGSAIGDVRREIKQEMRNVMQMPIYRISKLSRQYEELLQPAVIRRDPK